MYNPDFRRRFDLFDSHKYAIGGQSTIHTAKDLETK